VEVEYRSIILTGRFDAGRSVKLLSRTRDGRPGYHLITPLLIDDTGAVVLVDRGWVPVEGDAALSPAPAGVVGVEGYVRRFETPGRFTPDNDPAANAWFYLDRGEMASAMGFETVASFYVQQAPGAGPPGSYPQGSAPNIALRNPHLQYALTWYALAVVLLVIYVVFHVRRRVGED
jgi:surfeit locus 1 family protein